MHPLKILFLSAEAEPFAKVGGLGDVGGSLPKALRALGHDVRLAMPAYHNIEADIAPNEKDFHWLPELKVPMHSRHQAAGVLEGCLPGSDVPVYFIGERSLFDRPTVYGYSDEVYRFAFYCRAALELTLALEWKPDIVHANDWHTAPAITWLETVGQSDPLFREVSSLFTIHNLMHHGKTTWDIFNALGILTNRLAEEAYNEVNFMARAIYHATLVNTVSPTYAREIMTPEYGHGLDGLLRYRYQDVFGILNGVDYQAWDPAHDPRLTSPFDSQDRSGRAANKASLQEKLGLAVDPAVPLVAMVSRLDWQKGLDITGHVIHLLMNDPESPSQFVVLGSGASEYHRMFEHLASYHTEKMAAVLNRFDNDLAHLIYGGSDIFIMPSRFEPCGLGQILAMRYGSVPVVRSTGGLVDTVIDGITGFTFNQYTSEAFWQALKEALNLYRASPDSWSAIQRNGMRSDYSWERSAREYSGLYEQAVARKRPGLLP